MVLASNNDLAEIIMKNFLNDEVHGSDTKSMVELKNGMIMYFMNNKLDNDDGPCIIGDDGQFQFEALHLMNTIT